MKEAILKIAHDEVRNPATGWWGERYRHDGKIYFVDDISITFDMLSYLHGEVGGLDKIVSTALLLGNLNYPQGWREQGGYSNHNVGRNSEHARLVPARNRLNPMVRSAQVRMTIR